MRQQLLLLMAILVPILSNAEAIDGPANVRDIPNGKILYVLNNGTQVFPKEYQEKWYAIELQVCINLQDYDEINENIKPKSVLYSCRNNYGIGQLGEQPLKTGYWGKGEKYFIVNLRTGVTFKNNIVGEMLLEESLVFLLNMKKQTLKKWRKHLKTYFYRSISLKNPDLKAYYAEGNYLGDESPSPRIILVFNNNKLVSVVTGSSELEIANMRPLENRNFAISHITNNNAINKIVEKSINSLLKRAN